MPKLLNLPPARILLTLREWFDYKISHCVLMTWAFRRICEPCWSCNKYLREFVNLAGPAMLPHTSGILTAVLPCLAYEDEERRMVSFLLSFSFPFILNSFIISLVCFSSIIKSSIYFFSLPFSSITQELASLGWAWWALWMANHYEEEDEGDATAVVTKSDRTIVLSFSGKSVMVLALQQSCCSCWKKATYLSWWHICHKRTGSNIPFCRWGKCLGQWMQLRWSWWKGRRGTSWN